MTLPILETELRLCSRCGGAFLLLGPTVRGLLCGRCYHALGCPAALPVAPEVREANRQETARRMLKLGGDTAHLVRSGKAGL